MSGVERIQVLYKESEIEIPVGELHRVKQKLFFTWNTAWLQTGIELSPFRFKTSSGLVECPLQPFEGLPGVFADSLPDGWGRLLTDRAVQRKGIQLNDIGPLDRLAIVGDRGPGALIYRPSASMHIESSEHLDLDALGDDAEAILRDDPAQALDLLFANGGTSGGARPKVTLAIHPETGELASLQNGLPKGWEAWIVKFPAQNDPADVGAMEYAYARMAKACGIDMAPFRLIETPGKRRLFATRRFDYADRKRLHLHSLAGLLHDNFRYTNLDYGHLMDAAFKLERNAAAIVQVFRRAAFNVLANNRDDHSKNFAFLMDERGHWQLSPAYDLTWSTSAHGEHSMTVAGEGKSPSIAHLLRLADQFDMDRAHEVIDEVKVALAQWPALRNELGIHSYPLFRH